MSQKDKIRRATIELLVRLLRRTQNHSADSADVYFAYRLLLDRPPDAPSEGNWVYAAEHGLALPGLVTQFLESAEYKQRHGPLISRVELADFAMYVDAADKFIGGPIALTRDYEPHVTRKIRQELRPDDVFLDVGANMGWFTLHAASIARQGKVIAVEPNRTNVQLLYRSLLANQFNNVEVVEGAATGRHSILQLKSVRTNGGVSSPTTIIDSTDLVQGFSLDELLKDEPRLTILKMDIEGHEPFALAGMQGLIRRHQPLIFSEFHPEAMRTFFQADPMKYLEALSALNYDLSVIEFDGNELWFGKNLPGIMEHWHKVNESYRAGETRHLDLLARPHSSQA